MAKSTDQKGNTRTGAALGAMSLTDIVSRGTAVPGISEQAHPSAPPSLFQVIEASLEDILDSDYQTRESVDEERYKRLRKSMEEEKPKEYRDAIPVRVHPTIPDKLQVARGGHTRLKVARDLGYKTYPVIMVEYDNKRSALATGRENLAKAGELSPIEEGNYYLILKRDFGYTQESIAEEFGIKFNRIKECVAAAQSAPYIIAMFASIRDMGGDTDRGLRAAKYLRRLEVFDKETKEGEVGLGERLCAPLIEAYLHEKVFTDGLDLITKRLVSASDPEKELEAIIRDLYRSEQASEKEPQASDLTPVSGEKKESHGPEILRHEKINLTMRRFRQFAQLIGEKQPSDDERKILTNLKAEIDNLLTR